MENKNYWDARHASGDTPWNIGKASPPLTNYFDQLKSKNISILIPGAGHAHEARYLAERGFSDITICDISSVAIEKIRIELSSCKTIKYIEGDFFSLAGTFDLIVEQTFFCALNPELRFDYVNKAAELLSPGGTLAGVLFAAEFDRPGPPYGGSIHEYKALFNDKLHIHVMNMCYNSILPRKNNELFFICKKVMF